jgi:pentatricopeptide repeat protein
VDHGLNEDALHLLQEMEEAHGVLPDMLSNAYALKACGSLGALTKGREIHCGIVKRGGDLSEAAVDEQQQIGGDDDDDGLLALATSLIDMYSKCGSMEDARKLFDGMPSRDLVAWTVLIAGYAFVGMSELVFDSYRRMEMEGIEPDQIIFLSILAACSHDGHFDRAQAYFEAMVKAYRMAPLVEHLNCIVDLLGRAGRVACAIDLIEKVPMEPDLVTWNTALSSCRRWGDVELARHAFDRVLQLDGGHVGAYVLMANVYMDALVWENAKG